MSNDCVDDELQIIECLEDYCRILVNTATNVSGSVGGRKREVAWARAQMVKQLIDRLKELETEEQVDDASVHLRM